MDTDRHRYIKEAVIVSPCLRRGRLREAIQGHKERFYPQGYKWIAASGYALLAMTICVHLWFIKQC